MKTIESKYWPIELEVAGLVWIIKKIRYIVESATKVIIYTDYIITLDIVKQSSLISSLINRINLRLIRVSEFFSRFSLEVIYTLGKENLVADALLRLASDNQGSLLREDGELDILYVDIYNYTVTLVELSPNFRSRLITGYLQDKGWINIIEQIR